MCVYSNSAASFPPDNGFYHYSVMARGGPASQDARRVHRRDLFRSKQNLLTERTDQSAGGLGLERVTKTVRVLEREREGKKIEISPLTKFVNVVA